MSCTEINLGGRCQGRDIKGEERTRPLPLECVPGWLAVGVISHVANWHRRNEAIRVSYLVDVGPRARHLLDIAFILSSHNHNLILHQPSPQRPIVCIRSPTGSRRYPPPPPRPPPSPKPRRLRHGPDTQGHSRRSTGTAAAARRARWPDAPATRRRRPRSHHYPLQAVPKETVLL